MLELLFYLILQFGLVEDLSTTQQPIPTEEEIQTELLEGTTPILTTTDTSIGGSGWDDKN